VNMREAAWTQILLIVISYGSLHFAHQLLSQDLHSIQTSPSSILLKVSHMSQSAQGMVK
jgi:hypothetical protein